MSHRVIKVTLYQVVSHISIYTATSWNTREKRDSDFSLCGITFSNNYYESSVWRELLWRDEAEFEMDYYPGKVCKKCLEKFC